MRSVMQMVAVVCVVLSAAQARAQDLVGPPDAWFGVDNLEITYSEGTKLFNVRFDNRSFNDVFGAGAPDLLFTTPEDVEAALLALGDFLNGPPLAANQLSAIDPVPGSVVLDDGFLYPIDLTAETVDNPGNLDFSGPLGWRYGVRGVSVNRALDLVQAGKTNLAWAFFTAVDECPADFNGDGAVDGGDLAILLAAWNSPDSDLNGDGNTDAGDLAILLAAWGSCS